MLVRTISAWRRRWENLAELAQVHGTLRGGPGHRGPVSDHFDGRHFFNPGAPAGRSLADLLRWQFTRRASVWPSWVEHERTPSLPVALAEDQVALSFVNHVTFLIQFPGLTVLTDPVFSERASPLSWAGPRRVHRPGVALEQLPPVDLVFVSHNHYDHMDVPALREQGISPVLELDWWEESAFRGARLCFTPAQHWSTRGPGRRNHTLWGGLWLSTARCTLYFAGDTGYCGWFAQMQRRLGAPDLAQLPIGAYEPRWFMREQHMNPEDAVQAHLDLGARTSIAMHFGCFRLTDEAIDAPVLALERALLSRGMDDGAFHVPVPGETWLWRAPGAQPNR